MRRITCVFLIILLLGLFSMPAAAATEATGARVDAVLDTDGTCQITLAMTLRVEQAEQLYVPVPANARSITLNGGGASTRRDGDVLLVDVSRITGDAVGEFSIILRYTVPGTVAYTEAGKPQLTLPLLSGFSHPIQVAAFSVTLPEQVQYTPRFSSSYRLQSIEEDLVFEVNGNQVNGGTLSPVKDLEALTLLLQLTEETFPRSAVESWSGGIAQIIAFVLMGLATVYWFVCLRSAPHLRTATLLPPEGCTAGELRCALIGQGADLTMMVMSWAQMGYILIHLKENGRVVLYKRMEMGNERGSFENKVFRSLFGKKRTVDGSGYHYAQLYRKVAASRTSLQDLFRSQSGNPKVLRILGAAAGLCGGISLGISLAGDALLAVLIVLVLALAGAASAWVIQAWVEGLHLRNRGTLILALTLCVAWLILGAMAAGFGFALGMVAFQLLLGLAGAYGGRRTMSGRATTSRILGLRGQLKKLPPEELDRIRHTDPDYFFTMAPYALAMGVDRAFAAQFGRQRMNPCPWLTTGMDGHMTAWEWVREMRRAAASLDEHQKRLPWERLMGR